MFEIENNGVSASLMMKILLESLHSVVGAKITWTRVGVIRLSLSGMRESKRLFLLYNK